MSSSRTELLRQAEHLAQHGKTTSAIEVYQKLLAADPVDIIAGSALGDLYIKAAQPQEAIACFARMVKGYLQNGSTRSAIYIIKKILKIDPTNLWAQMELGEVYLQTGASDSAHDYFIEAGAAFAQRGNSKAAIAACQRALQANPDSRKAKAALLALQEETTQPKPVPAPPVRQIRPDVEPILISIGETAAPVAREVPPVADLADNAVDSVSAPPRSATAGPSESDEASRIDNIMRAELLVGYGRIEEAIACLRENLKRRPDDIDVRLRLKDVYLRAGVIDRASDECLNIAGLYAARGDAARAKDFMVRAELIARAADGNDADPPVPALLPS